jgi:hypothetical protein
MTELLFRDDAYVRRRDARVLAVDGDGFHPGGGRDPLLGLHDGTRTLRCLNLCAVHYERPAAEMALPQLSSVWRLSCMPLLYSPRVRRGGGINEQAGLGSA